jgi:futalosine hydrolase
MHLLIVAATKLEIAPLLTNFKYVTTHNTQLSTYSFNGAYVDVLITGVGMVNTTYWLTKTLVANKYNYVLNVGIAGSFSTKLTLGTCVNVAQDCFSEMGAESNNNFITMETLGFMPKHQLVIQASHPYQNTSSLTLTKVNGITVNTVHGNTASINKVEQLYSPMVESMEGAAVLNVCNLEAVYVLQIRAISNRVEQRNTANWNIPLAIHNLNNIALQVVLSS